MDTALAVLLDKTAIVDVTIRYCTALDTRDWALLATCFTDDAHARYQRPGEDNGTTFIGYAAIEQRLSESMNVLGPTQHCVSNHVIEVTGDEAACRCYVRAQHTRRSASDGVEHFMVGGSYRDRFVHTEHGWRITDREMTYTWADAGWAASAAIPGVDYGDPV